jgi:hypothetical protein
VVLIPIDHDNDFAENIDANVDASRDELGRRYCCSWKRCDSGAESNIILFDV